jgi:hypothetical protein
VTVLGGFAARIDVAILLPQVKKAWPRDSKLGQAGVLKQGCDSPNMGTEAIKSKDINGRRRPLRSTGYHFFLLA